MNMTTRTATDDLLWTQDQASARLTEGLDDPLTSASPTLPRKYCLSLGSSLLHCSFIAFSPFQADTHPINMRPTRTTNDPTRTDQAWMGQAEGLITPRQVSLPKNLLLFCHVL